MDLDILSMVIDELSAVLPDSRVDKAVPVENGGLSLFLHKGNQRPMLFMGPDRTFPRIHVMTHKPVPARHPAGFYLQVKKHLVGARLLGLALVRGDRIVELIFQRSSGKRILIFELTGGGSNIILTDEDKKIITVLHPQPLEIADKRSLLPGLTYEPPPRPASVWPPGKQSDLFEGLSLDGELPRNRAVEEWYRRVLDDKRSSEMRIRIQGTIRRSREKAERRIVAIEKDLAAAGLLETWREQADMILANLGAIRKGMEQCELPDSEGRLVKVPLDPLRSPVENAERLFRKYKKAKAGASLMRERLAASREERDLLISLNSELQQGTNNDLVRIGNLLQKSGFGERPVGTERTAGSSLTAPYRVVVYKEWEILVGRSAAGNDYISMLLAKPEDLWLHAEGMPGSHVLVRNPRRADVPPDVMAKAASLAAYYSRGKGSTKVPVAYTQAKYVKKPKGAKPGMVILVERRSVMAVPTPA